MNTSHQVKLSSAEVAYLWMNFMGDSMVVCTFTHFLENIEDPDIHSLVTFAKELSVKHLTKITHFFTEEQIPIPIGFSVEKDVFPGPRLYTDPFYLYYVENMAKGGLKAYSSALPECHREDVREYFSSCLTQTIELFNRVIHLLLNKGLAIRSPYLVSPKEVEWVHRQSFLSGWFGDKRSLTNLEVSQLYSNIQTNSLGQVLLTGCAQTAQDPDVRDYMKRGMEISKKHIDLFETALKSHNLPSPTTWANEVTESIQPVFSDSLMMYHVGLLNGNGLGNYGLALSHSLRRDIAALFTRLMAEVGQYSEDGVNLQIKHKWLEKPPTVPEREELISRDY